MLVGLAAPKVKLANGLTLEASFSCGLGSDSFSGIDFSSFFSSVTTGLLVNVKPPKLGLSAAFVESLLAAIAFRASAAGVGVSPVTVLWN